MQYYATDRAGNIGEPQTMHVNIDGTPPAISSQTDPPANPEGWHRTDVVVSFDASDTLSGLAESPASGVIVTDEGAEFEVSAVAEDRAGNTATASVVVNLDKTVPDITIATPGNNATYLLHASASASFSCSDVLSGVASCVGPVANGEPLDTSRVGEREFAVLARDVADNIRGLTVRYAVRYGFSGFFPPLSSSGSVRVNPGRAIPVKWRLFDARQTPVRESAAIAGVASYPVACETEVAMGAAQPASGELHNVGKGLYSFNWRTESEWVGCRVLELSLVDGATHRALVEFRPRR